MLGVELLPRTESTSHNGFRKMHIALLNPQDFRHKPPLLKNCLGGAVNCQVDPIAEIAQAAGQFNCNMLHGRRGKWSSTIISDSASPTVRSPWLTSRR